MRSCTAAVTPRAGGTTCPPPRSPTEVTRVAAGLIAAGVQAGDRVAVLSRTRYEWSLADYAILAAGAVTVPIYETSSPDQISWIVSDSGAVGIVVETDEHTQVGREDARGPARAAHDLADRADGGGAERAGRDRAADQSAARTSRTPTSTPGARPSAATSSAR